VSEDIRNIWLLSAYKADSHNAWADRLVSSHPQINWNRLELPGRFFSWRIRGNPLSWLDSLPDEVPDLIIATSMVDLATLKGLHPRLAPVPAYYYFHENQFAYPVNEQQVRTLEPQMVQLYGALAAQRLVFNSKYNQESFLDGVEQLLGSMPDEVPEGVRERCQKKSEVLAVPVTPVAPGRKDKGLIVWNHRWEYDKAPDVFTDAMIELERSGADYKLALLGARHSTPFEPLEKIRNKLADRIVLDGKVDDDQYRLILGKACIVVSTSLHEFQGLSIMEAASAGARPLVPDALCYKEQYEACYRYPAGDIEALKNRLAKWLDVDLPPPADVSAWTGPELSERWGRMLRT